LFSDDDSFTYGLVETQVNANELMNNTNVDVLVHRISIEGVSIALYSEY